MISEKSIPLAKIKESYTAKKYFIENPENTCIFYYHSVK